MEPLNIYTFGQHLSVITVDSIHETIHFQKRIKSRFGEDFIKEVYRIIFDCTPVGILQQDEQKFKVLYPYNEDYDLTIIFDTKGSKSLIFTLISCYKVESKRRVRVDEQERQ